MYLDTVKNKQGDKVYTRHLLRESYREGKKVKHRTIANLSHCSPEEIEAVRLALKHKKKLTELLDGTTKPGRSDTLKQGLSVGAVWVIADIARQIGIKQLRQLSLIAKYHMQHGIPWCNGNY